MINVASLRIAALGAAFSIAAVANAQVSTWHNIGTIGGPVFVLAGLGSSLIQDGSLGASHAARTFDGVLVTGAAAELIKFTTRERRPYGTTLDSFPSEHTTAAFAVAAAQAYYHPSQAPLWYAGATVIGIARVAGHDHHIQDVLAGAALGFAGGRLSVMSRHRWIVAPVVERNHAALAVSFTTHF